MVKYKIGDPINTKYASTMQTPYAIGQRVDVYHKDTYKKVATFEVITQDGKNVLGLIINTYGHRRFQR